MVPASDPVTIKLYAQRRFFQPRSGSYVTYDDVVALTVRLGGTLAGEHGDGRLRAPLLRRVWHKDSLQAFEVLKKSFDPDNIFNPGAKIPLPGQKALGDIKYDPLLPPLPAEARSALDDVVKRRAYNEFRLSLIPASP